MWNDCKYFRKSQFKRRGNRRKRTSNRVPNHDLRSNAQLKQHGPQNQSCSFASHCSLCVGHGCVADCDRLRPTPLRLASVRKIVWFMLAARQIHYHPSHKCQPRGCRCWRLQSVTHQCTVHKELAWFRGSHGWTSALEHRSRVWCSVAGPFSYINISNYKQLPPLVQATKHFCTLYACMVFGGLFGGVSALGEMFMTCASHLQLCGFEASALELIIWDSLYITFVLGMCSRFHPMRQLS